ncbi:MAG: phage head-tail connector protein [Planctomycetes bacterium]|nr:phage head-tail connector protein [Planctomycetota bacterium]
MGVPVEVTAPATEPVTLPEVKAQATIDFASDDALLLDLIAAARADVEEFLRRQLITATYDLSLDSFADDGRIIRDGVIHLPLPPLLSVVSITYTDTAGSSIVLDSSKYDVDVTALVGRIAPSFGNVWPATRAEMNAVVIRFSCGYGTADDLPKNIKQGLLMHIADLYEHRESQSEILLRENRAAGSLLWRARVLEA